MRKMAGLFRAGIATLAVAWIGIGHAGPAELEAQVRETEAAFARTMADRDFDSFAGFLDEETVFFAGETPLEGKQAVMAAWRSYYEGPDAPFSWQPETVVSLQSGQMALSSGPVWNAAGERVATFNSIWRRGENGEWKIVFDKGFRFCAPPEPSE